MSSSAQPLPTSIELSRSHVASTDAAVIAIGFSCVDRDPVRTHEGAAVRHSGEPKDYVVGLSAEQQLLDLGVDVFALLDRAKATGRAGETVSLEVFGSGAVEQVLLVGLGQGRTLDYRRAGAAVGRAARDRGAVATPIGALGDEEQLGAFTEGLVIGAFGFHRKSGGPRRPSTPLVVLTEMTGPPRSTVVDEAVVRAKASWRSRAFALTPSNEKGPQQLERWAREAADRAGLDVRVWDDAQLAADGFGGILAVGAGSAYPSRFVRLDYTPGKATRRTPHLVLVGKGITFDTGGISIKAADAMKSMKRDMTGAGVVIAVMGALRELDVPVKVTGLVASAENAFGAASMRPGDVVTHYGGRTSAVGNTDAEGRLVLADALAYADANIDATAVVDIATLTGAGKVALGTTLGALFAADDDLAEALRAAGAAAGEPVWRLPLSAEYEPLLEDMAADATNAPGGPGSITAALFLQHFAGAATWAHLDIASVGDSPKDALEYTEGATGFGARLLLRWIQGVAARAGRR